MKILIGIPAYNEEENIARIITRLKQDFENILVCDDGSSDMTSDIASSLGAKVVKHETNMGYGSAIKTIFNEAKNLDIDILVTFDGDGQHQISDISNVIEPIFDNRAEIVIGSRFLGSSKIIPKYRKLGIKIITGLTNSLTGSEITDAQSGFRAYSKKVLNEISLSESGMGISTEIIVKSNKKNFRIAEVPIIVSYLNNKHSQPPVSHGASVVISTIKHVAIQRPLLYFGVTGLSFLIIGLVFGIWSIQIYSVERVLMTNIALIGIGGVILGVLLMITATILFSINTILKER